jgi:hypothetical protein
MPNYSIFISYSRDDAEIVVPLVKIVRATGAGAFQDLDSIAPGCRWQPVIMQAIADCELFLLFWCHHAASSNAVKGEYEEALALGKRLAPVLIDSTPLPKPLLAYQWIDLRQAIGTHEEREVEVEGGVEEGVEEDAYVDSLGHGSWYDGPYRHTTTVRITQLTLPDEAQLARAGCQLWETLGEALANGQWGA